MSWPKMHLKTKCKKSHSWQNLNLNLNFSTIHWFPQRNLIEIHYNDPREIKNGPWCCNLARKGHVVCAHRWTSLEWIHYPIRYKEDMHQNSSLSYTLTCLYQHEDMVLVVTKTPFCKLLWIRLSTKCCKHKGMITTFKKLIKMNFLSH